MQAVHEVGGGMGDMQVMCTQFWSQTEESLLHTLQRQQSISFFLPEVFSVMWLDVLNIVKGRFRKLGKVTVPGM